MRLLLVLVLLALSAASTDAGPIRRWVHKHRQQPAVYAQPAAPVQQGCPSGVCPAPRLLLR